MKYQANRGGHAPGHLREAFEQLSEHEAPLEPGDFLPEHVQEIFFDEKKRTVSWLFGQLWNCTDVMPGTLCDELELPRDSTYAQGVRKLKELLV